VSVATLMDRRTTVLAALLLVAGTAFAQPNKEQYELQERCGKRAAEVFAKEWGTGFTAAAHANYENHYSSRLNKCF
jgi:hypothetical protein